MYGFGFGSIVDRGFKLRASKFISRSDDEGKKIMTRKL